MSRIQRSGLCSVFLFWVVASAVGENLDPKKLKELKAAMEKAEAALKKVEAETTKATEDAKAAYQKAFEAYRSSLSNGTKARTAARTEAIKAKMKLQRYERTGRELEIPQKKRQPRVKSPELQKLDAAVTAAREAISTAQKNWRKAIGDVNEFRRKHFRSKEEAIQKKLKALEKDAETAREQIQVANKKWFEAVKARNAYYRKPKLNKKDKSDK